MVVVAAAAAAEEGNRVVANQDLASLDLVVLVDDWGHSNLGSHWFFISCSPTDETFGSDMVDLAECEILIVLEPQYMYNEDLLVS